MFCFTHTQNIVKATAAKQLLLCSQKCPERRVCVTSPHNSASVEALLKPQILNGECSLAGVSASRCVLYLRSSCFWSVPVPAFAPVQKTALTSSQIILSPSLWSLCLSTQDSRKGLDSRNLTTPLKFLLLHAIVLLVLCFGTEYLEKNNPTDGREGCFSLVFQELAEVAIRTLRAFGWGCQDWQNPAVGFSIFDI